MTALGDRFVRDRPGRSVLVQECNGPPPRPDLVTAADRGNVGPGGGGRRPFVRGTAGPDLRGDEPAFDTLGPSLFRLAEQLSAVAEQIPAMSPHEAEDCIARTVDTLIILTRNLRPGRALPSSRNQPIRFTVEKFIDAGLSSPKMSPATIADDLEIPRSTLYKAFTDVGGVARYIQDRRLAAARSLLLRSDECRSVGQIASSLGFENCATFSKAFRKRFGRSPRSMRALGTAHAMVLRQQASPRPDREWAAT